LVKVCGLTREEDVEFALTLGAWAVGLIFAPSPRRVTPATARGLVRVVAEAGVRPGGRTGGSALEGGAVTVGVFGDVSAETIAAVVDEVGLGAAQLHGSKPDVASVREALAGRERRVLLIKAIAVPAAGADPGEIGEAVAGARAYADLILFDTRSQGRSGGTGRTFVWETVRDAAGGVPYLVAGGIGPHNVREALDRSGAWGVDVSSGVEASPGVKDHELLRALFASLSAPQVRLEGTSR